ncbi:hypothetical protein [Glycomyces sp. NRRL B-16210]|uniref:hypothetical protein n=1 Tax=Glycomyces sp. NRRL B-16210 TaxID=1463821 RepID=UPI00068E8164|nr:hypothetical protein [Glycomyces sp. NRRL B-16210]
MSDIEFKVPEFNLLLALVHLRGSGTTAVFREAFGFEKVETSAQKALLAKELIVIDKGVRPYVYELTDAGWLTARQLLSETAPAGVSSRTARILWAVIGDFSNHMQRTNTELADIYPARLEPTTAERIVEAYGELVEDSGDWLPLRSLRDHLASTDRDELDKVLTELHAEKAVLLIPESNQKTLTEADREAAIWLGGEYRHLIGIEVR